MTFKDYVESREDYIHNYLEYCANKDNISLAEAARRSLSRLHSLVADDKSKYPMAFLTAFRGERNINQNRIANQSLENDFVVLGWGFTPVLGGFVEKIRDANGKETGETRRVEEESYFVIGRGNADLFDKNILNLLHKYAQEAAVVKYPGDPTAFLLSINGEKSPLGAWSQNKLSQYYTRIKRGPVDRQFAFEAAADTSRNTRMAVSKFKQNG